MPAIAVLLGFILALITLPGCAVFTPVKPSGEFTVKRFLPETRPDGSTRLALHDAVVLGGEWNKDDQDVRVKEQYGWDEGHGINYLLSREYSLERTMDPTVAGEAFGRQAQLTGEFADIMGTMAGAMVAQVIQLRMLQEEQRTERRQIEATRDVTLEELRRLYPDVFEEHHATPAPPEPEE